MADKPAWTPGPWSACHHGECKCGLVFGDGGNVFVAHAYGPDDINRIDPVPLRDCQAANAKLISAAPELYEALEAEQAADEADADHLEMVERAAAEDWLNDPTGSLHVNEAGRHAQDLRSKARAMREAAMAKARGETPPPSPSTSPRG